ncbi:MAG: polysaccharide biosynthesis tyrosine autokinase [Candidatus Omnitrophica bacterium]|nr:polysaccharide biosynthesis tyrosine autokinase [Candidatus Omnitrophota bacterium]
MPLRTEFEWQPEDYLRAFWLHRWFILFFCLTTALFSSLYAAQKPNIYKASTRILIEIQAPQVVKFQEVSPSFQGPYSQNFLLTEYRVISSRVVLNRVVEELHLAAFPPFAQSKDPVAVLERMLTVEPVRGTKLVDIGITSTKPDFAARIANGVATVYAQVNLERRREMTTGGAAWLRDEVLKMEDKMQAAQLALQEFREKHSTIDFGQNQQNTLLQRLQALNASLIDTRKQRIEAETKYREKHPTILELQAKEQELQLALFDVEQKVLEMNRLSIQYDSLVREVKTNEEIYGILLKRSKELAVQEGLQTNNVQVVDYALTPEKPIGPNRARAVSAATLAGFLVSGFISILRELFTQTIRTRRDFERFIGLPFLGHVPLVRQAGKSVRDKPLLLTMPHSQVAESIRAVRTTLEFMLSSDKKHVLLVTSALPEEGKTFVSLNLTLALLELGRQVILIDADLRRPNLYRQLKIELEPGLSGYLQGQVESEELVKQVPVGTQTMPVMTAGLTPPQPTDVLSSPKFQELLDSLREQYQYVIVDAPPILVAADASILSRISTGVLFILRAGVTHVEAALAGKQRLVDVGAPLIGGVLNGARLEMEHGYRYYYYSKKYHAASRSGSK